MGGWHGDGGAGGTTALWDFLMQHPQIHSGRGLVTFVDAPTTGPDARGPKEAHFFDKLELYHMVYCMSLPSR